MFEKLANIFRVPDLRKRVLFTLGMLAVYRLGSHIPTPGINTSQLEKAFQQQSGGLLGFYDLFSGGNLRRLTIFALGIMPYITASIILQLLTVVWEPLARLQKEGDLGRRKITQWTRYLTLILSVLQSMGIAFTLADAEVRLEPWIVVHPDDDHYPDHGQHLHHVAGRADHGTRRRQRHVIADFRGHCRRIAKSRSGSGAKGALFSLGKLYCSSPADSRRDHGAGGGVHRLHGTLRAAHSGAVCQARCRTPHYGRPVHAPAVAREFRRRNAGDFCFVAAQHSADAYAFKRV